MSKKQCCGSGMFIPDPDFYPSRIPDPKTATKERGEQKFVVIPFFVAQISQNWILFYFWYAEEKNLAQFSKNYWSLYPKIVTKWVWDPGSEIRDPEKTYSGSRIQGSKRHRIRIRIHNTSKKYLPIPYKLKLSGHWKPTRFEDVSKLKKILFKWKCNYLNLELVPWIEILEDVLCDLVGYGGHLAPGQLHGWIPVGSVPETIIIVMNK